MDDNVTETIRKSLMRCLAVLHNLQNDEQTAAVIRKAGLYEELGRAANQAVGVLDATAV